MASSLISSDGANFGNSRTPFNWTKFIDVSRDFTTNWLDVDLVKYQLNIYGDTSLDTYIEQLTLVAKTYIEDYIGKSINNRSYRAYYRTNVLSGSSNVITLDVPETQATTASVTQVSYYNSASPPVQVVIPASNWFFDPTGNQVILTTGPSLADVNQYVDSPIMVDYAVGAQGSLSGNPAIQHAGFLLVTHWYDNRGDATDRLTKMIPHGVTNLLRPYKDLTM